MLAGTAYRLAEALQLAREHGRRCWWSRKAGWVTAGRARRRRRGAKVICFEPNPANTRGEAEFVGRLAAQYHWRSVILVTSPAQDTRARILMRRCFGGSVYVMTRRRCPGIQWPYEIAYGWGALVKALVLSGPAYVSSLVTAAERRGQAVPLRHHGHGPGPRDRQVRIVEGDGYVLGGIVGAVDAVGHVRRVGEGLKSVRAAGWHVQRDLLVVPEHEAFPVQVRRRRRPQVHHDVEDRPERASDELGFTLPAAYVQSAHHAARRAGQAVLREGGRVDTSRAHHVGVEGAAEEPALVHVRGGPENQDAVNAPDPLYLHLASLLRGSFR